jgi:(p)ppGpp synthase/HD superfamily hydrolase
MKSFEQIIEIVNEKFKGKYRKGTVNNEKIPAALHSLVVFYAAYRYGVSIEWVLRAILCHDLLEDTDTTVDELREWIGDDATNVVIELTFRPDEMEKSQYISSFGEKSVAAIVAKEIDRIENVKDFEVTDYNYAAKYFHKADRLHYIFYYRKEEIVSLFGIEVFHAIDLELRNMRDKYGVRK